MKKAIVTGANGFIGSAIVKDLLSRNVEVYALGRASNKDNIPAGAHFVEYDLTDSGKLLDLIADRDIDVFYHCAWTGSAGTARFDTALQLQNAQWTIENIQTAKALGCKRVVCAGSIMEQETIMAVYAQGNQPGKGYIYGSGKVVAHLMAMPVAADLGIELVWAEITNAYGAGELSPRFINTTIRKILNHEPLQFTAATQNYDFVYIDDVARAFYMIGENGRPYHHYLIGSSHAKPLREYILEIKEAIAQDQEFVFGDIPFTGVDLPLEKFDCSLTEEHTGFRAEISFQDGIKRTMEWIKEQG